MPRQNAAESRKIPESGSVIPREGVERNEGRLQMRLIIIIDVIPREGVESNRIASLIVVEDFRVIPREGVER